MKKVRILTIALIISLIFGLCSFLIQREQRRMANEVFKSNLQIAEFCFVQNYNIMNDDEKNYNYTLASSGLHTALSIFHLTSYANMEKNGELFDSISALARCMKKNNSRWKAVSEKSSLIYEYLTYIRYNPKDKDSCKELSKIANDLILNNE